MKELNSVLLKIGETHNGRVKFPITESKSLLETPIEELNFDARSYNVLKRLGKINTLQDVLENLSMLHKARGCGAKTISRIMYQICSYHYGQLNPNEREQYLNKMIELNI